MGPRSSAATDAWRYIAEFFFSEEIQARFLSACEAAGVTPPQLKALLSLDAGQARPMGALAAGWKCDASWATGIVDGLEEHGYVERQTHPTDRRVKVVAMTPLGEKAKAAALERVHQPPAALGALSPAEQRQLRDLLAKVHLARQTEPRT